MNGNALTARRVEAEEPDPYLAPALKAAAAARARTARIRAGQAQRSASPAPQRPPQRPPQPAAARPAGPSPKQTAAEAVQEPAAAPKASGLSVAAAARATTVPFRPLPRSPEAPARVWSPAAPRFSAGAATPAPDAGGATPAPEPAIGRAAPARSQQRFVRTMAAVELSQAAAREREARGALDGPLRPGIVPRPALRRPAPAAAGSPWSRLWPLRKDEATE